LRSQRRSRSCHLLAVGIEGFNAFDKENVADPIADLGDPRFGRSSSTLAYAPSGTTGLASAYQIGGPRTVQFSLELRY